MLDIKPNTIKPEHFNQEDEPNELIILPIVARTISIIKSIYPPFGPVESPWQLTFGQQREGDDDETEVVAGMNAMPICTYHHGDSYPEIQVWNSNTDMKLFSLYKSIRWNSRTNPNFGGYFWINEKSF